jgi:signal transduction histidine kinase
VTGPQDLRDILVVDDEALDRELVRRLLPGEVPVREAATAAEARAQLAGAVPDLVLLDHHLPDVDGVDLLPLFVERHVPVVMLTGAEDPETIVAAMQRGAEDYLVKGALTRDGLARALANAVEKAALRRRLREQHAALVEQAEALEVRNGEIRSLAAALTLAEQAERHRIAEVLHDDVQQLLVGALFHLQALQGARPAEYAERAVRVGEIIQETLRYTRTLVVDLTPPVPEEDLEVALRWVGDHMARLHDVAVHVSAATAAQMPSRDLRVLVVQSVRELIFNAIKHAGVKEVHVRLYEADGALVVAVEDAGRGFDPETGGDSPTNGFGLTSVRERLGRPRVVSGPAVCGRPCAREPGGRAGVADGPAGGRWGRRSSRAGPSQIRRT